MDSRIAEDTDWGQLKGHPAPAADPCVPLQEQIEELEDQVALLQQGMPEAPGAQRAALAKEITERRDELDAQREALHRCREASSVQPSSR
jgi:hypothetical protein